MLVGTRNTLSLYSQVVVGCLSQFVDARSWLHECYHGARETFRGMSQLLLQIHHSLTTTYTSKPSPSKPETAVGLQRRRRFANTKPSNQIKMEAGNCSGTIAAAEIRQYEAFKTNQDGSRKLQWDYSGGRDSPVRSFQIKSKCKP